MTRSRLAMSVIVALAIPIVAWAQEGKDGWGGRGFLTFNVGVQTASPDLGYASSTPFWGDTAKAGLTIPGHTGAAFDIGGGVRLVQNLGVAVVYSRYSKERMATLTTTIPNPLQEFGYGQPSTIEHQLPLQREEDAIHLQAMYRVPITNKLQIGLFGGPTFFRCLDDVVSEFALTGELYGYSLENINWNVKFDRITQTVEKDSSWGYHGGTDATYLFTRHFGVGTTVRYSRASHTTVNHFGNPDMNQLEGVGIWTAGDITESITMKHGGFHWNGGVTFRF